MSYETVRSILREAREKQVTELVLRRHDITTLPPEIGQLSCLKRLLIWHCKLETLPPEIGDLKNLRWLGLAINRLESVPDEIGRLQQLENLFLAQNRLQQLPPGIGQLSKLRLLNVANNELKDLPVELLRLERLEQLYLKGNPELSIPPEILKQNSEPKQILTYYFENVSTRSRTRPLHEVKMLIVGQGSVGKTSLVRRLVDNTFNIAEDKTPGINIRRWNRQIDDKEIAINVWDFGGQEIMHTTHQFFLSERSLYLLVIDARQGEVEGRIHYWLNIIESFGHKSPVIIVVNKIDAHYLALDEWGLRARYGNIKGFVRTSCLTKEGLQDLSSLIDDSLRDMAYIDDPLAESWFEVKKRLETMPDDYISYTQYEHICRNAGVPSEQSQQTLIHYLHELGIALNFRHRDQSLEETFILNPTWVTQGIYAIINSTSLARNGGVLQQNGLDDILDSRRYPRRKHKFILEMMRQFELCFRFVDTDDLYLVPDLLPKNTLVTRWDLHDSLLFDYRYRVLPSSVFSRLLVRVNHLVDRDCCWRTGAVLKDARNKALVVVDQAEEKISIAVAGTPTTRRDFLSLIRAQLDAIHASIEGLRVTQHVPIPGKPHWSIPYGDLLDFEAKEKQSIKVSGVDEWFPVKWLLDNIDPPEERRERRSQLLQIQGDFVVGDKFDVGDISDSKGIAIGRRGNKTVLYDD